MRTGWTEYATGATQPRSIQGASTIDEAVVAAPPVATTASSSFLGLENQVPGQPTTTAEFVGLFGARERKLLGDVHP